MRGDTTPSDTPGSRTGFSKQRPKCCSDKIGQTIQNESKEDAPALRPARRYGAAPARRRNPPARRTHRNPSPAPRAPCTRAPPSSHQIARVLGIQRERKGKDRSRQDFTAGLVPSAAQRRRSPSAAPPAPCYARPTCMSQTRVLISQLWLHKCADDPSAAPSAPRNPPTCTLSD